MKARFSYLSLIFTIFTIDCPMKKTPSYREDTKEFSIFYKMNAFNQFSDSFGISQAL